MMSNYLTLVVVRGKDLAAKDVDVNGAKFSSDPYCMVRIVPGGSTTKKTRFIKRTLNPVWNHQFEMGLITKGSSLQVTCWDRDLFSTDDYIGGVMIPLDEYLAAAGDHLKWFPLIGKRSTEVSGEIQLRLAFHPRKSKDKKNNKVLSLSNLPPMELKEHKIFGVPLSKVMKDQSEKYPSLKVPFVVHECIKALRYHLEVEGIFRLSCGHQDLQNLVKRFDAGEEIELNKSSDCNLVAGLLKLYFRSLPTPLLTYDLYDEIIKVTDDISDELISDLKERIHQIPDVNYQCAREMFDLLRDITHHSLENKMTATNLAIVVTPSLVWGKVPTMDTSTFEKSASVVAVMIEQFSFMFEYTAAARKKQPISRADGNFSLTIGEGRRLFATYDISNNGFLDRSEFKNFYIDFIYKGKTTVSEEEVDSCLAMLDKNGDGQISSQEFLQWWKVSGNVGKSMRTGGYSLSKLINKT